MRQASAKPCGLPFALALFSDADRLPPLEELASALPEGIPPIAVIFRHDHLEAEERIALAERVRKTVQGRGHLFLMARGVLAGADGCHAYPEGEGIVTMPTHDEDEIVAAIMAGADAGFLSPIHGTRSHPGREPLGRERAVALAQASPLPLFALGGMNEVRAAELEGTPFQGFGAIDAFAAGTDI
ncbi:hypothetical protein GCM10007148_13820 [Parvularcula lutaonensis]|nr:hypothetical protein GCM10007148_13820 [Parvularcula lutaonensis]